MLRIEAVKKNVFLLGIMLALAAPVAPVAAQDSEQAFFSGKTVRFVVGFGPGGGYDSYARMLAPYLSKALGATVIVENRPGAGGLLALNGVYISPPDGLTMMIVNGTARGVLATDRSAGRALRSRQDRLPRDAERAAIAVDRQSALSRSRRSRRRSRPRENGGGPRAARSTACPTAPPSPARALKLDCQIVLGYKGSNDAALAVSRGEMDALYVTDTSANTLRSVERAHPARNDRAEAIAVLSRSADHLRGGKAQCRSGMGVQLPAHGPKPGPHPGGAARHDRQPAGVPGSGRRRKPSAIPSFLAEGDKRQLYTDYVDAAGTRKNATSIVTTVTPEQRKLVQDILARAR